MDFEALHLLANVAAAIADQQSQSLSLILYKEKKNDKKKKKKKRQKLQPNYSSWSLHVSDSSSLKLTLKKKQNNPLVVPRVPTRRKRSINTRKPSRWWSSGEDVVAAAGIKRSFSQIELPLQEELEEDRHGVSLKKRRTIGAYKDRAEDSESASDNESTITVVD